MSEQSVVDSSEVGEQYSFYLRINYKSGKSIEGWFDKFKTKQSAGELNSVEWKESGDEKLRVVYMGISEIESIEQLNHRVIKQA